MPSKASTCARSKHAKSARRKSASAWEQQPWQNAFHAGLAGCKRGSEVLASDQSAWPAPNKLTQISGLTFSLAAGK